MSEVPAYTENKYWGKAPEAELEKALAVIDAEGWDAFEARYHGTFDFTTQENRADWRFFTPLSRESVVLDVGAGLGRISIPLARVVGKVIACDTSTVRMRFLKKLAQAKGLTNVETLVADILEPPFEEGTFDLIVMNGVLEWVGKTDRCADPREAQVAALRACKRLLKPGGCLYVGIENRAALAYLRGIDHSGLRFTSYLPRFLADWYTRMRKGHRYDTYTYTKKGYAKLFAEAGLDPDFYLVYPGYNLPRVLIPYERLGILSYALSTMTAGNTRGRRFMQSLMRFGLAARAYRHVFFSFGIFARK